MSSENGKDAAEAGPSGEGKLQITAEAMEQLVSDPATLEALSKTFASYMSAQGPAQVLPPAIRRRVRALKKIQFEFTKFEAEFYKEVQELEAKYAAKYQPLYDQRRDIVSGSHEPTDEESHWSGDEDEDPEEGDDGEKKDGDKTTEEESKGPDGATPDDKENNKGIPEFWTTALRNADLFGEMIKEHDEPVLNHLVDIKVVFVDATGTDFRLDFHFSDNEWFTNKVLPKTYNVSCEVNKDRPWDYEGATITSCKGCKIDWKKGKNLTVKTVKKKQKHKGRGQSRTVTKTVPNESFFNFFSPPDPEKDEEEEEGEIAETLASDFLRAEFLRDRLVPKAVLFFTGEAIDDDEDDFDEGDEDDEDDDDEDDEEYDARRDLSESKPPECKTQ